MAMVRVNKTLGRFFTSGHRMVYKLTNGRLGAQQGEAQVAVLTTTGRKSGRDRERPIIIEEDGDGWLVVASYSGHDEHPGWYHNLKANPVASLLVGATTHSVVATELEGQARATAWAAMASSYPDYDEYQKVTERQIPVLRLARA